jgi:hypothetical protein
MPDTLVEEGSITIDVRIGHQTLFDSGCSFHRTRNTDQVTNYVDTSNGSAPFKYKITLASGISTEATGYGNHWYLGTVLVVPDLIYDTVISIGLLDRVGYTVVMSRGIAMIYNYFGQIAMIGHRLKDSLYLLHKIFLANIITRAINIKVPPRIDTIMCLCTSMNIDNSSSEHSTSQSADASSSPTDLDMIIPVIDEDMVLVEFFKKYTMYLDSLTAYSLFALSQQMGCLLRLNKTLLVYLQVHLVTLLNQIKHQL